MRKLKQWSLRRGLRLVPKMTAQMEQVEERNVSGVLHVASIFGSHMVLQRNKPIAVFGALAADCAGMEVVAEGTRL